jgi:hypothetical protein
MLGGAGRRGAKGEAGTSLRRTYSAITQAADPENRRSMKIKNIDSESRAAGDQPEFLRSRATGVRRAGDRRGRGGKHSFRLRQERLAAENVRGSA